MLFFHGYNEKKKENILKMALISGSRLKLTLCNKMKILLQETTQTLCIIFHHSFCLIPFYPLVSFFPFHFVTVIHAGAFLNRDFAIAVSFPTHPCLSATVLYPTRKLFLVSFSIILIALFLTYFLIISSL